MLAEPLFEQGRKEREDSLWKEWRGAKRMWASAAKDRDPRERGLAGGPETAKLRENGIFKEAAECAPWDISKENLERALNGVIKH